MSQKAEKNRLYKILEIQPDATETEIKKGYRRLAMKYHPDKNAHNPDASDKFKEIGHAYEILSDPQKRSVYDQYGEEGLSGEGGMGGGMSAEDLFSQFFGGGGMGGMGGMFGGGMQQQGPKRSRDIVHVHKVSLEDLYKGKVSKLALQKKRYLLFVRGPWRKGRCHQEVPWLRWLGNEDYDAPYGANDPAIPDRLFRL